MPQQVPGWWDGVPTPTAGAPALGWWAVVHGYGQYTGEGHLEVVDAYAKTPAGVPLTGYGDLDSAAYAVVPASMLLEGGGALASQAYAVVPRSVLLAAVGQLAAQSWERYGRNANHSGSGQLAATAFEKYLPVGELTGSGNLVAAAFQKYARAAGFTGSGSLSSDAYAIIPGSALLNGLGHLAAQAYAIVPRSALLTGSGVLSASTFERYSRALNMSGLGTLLVTAGMRYQRSAMLSGEGVLSAIVGQRFLKDLGLSGAGLLESAAYARVPAEFSGITHLTDVTYTGFPYTGFVAPTYEWMNSGTAYGNANGNQHLGLSTPSVFSADLGSDKYVSHIVLGYDYQSTVNASTPRGPSYTDGVQVVGRVDGGAAENITVTPTYASTGSTNGLVTIPIGGVYRYIGLTKPSGFIIVLEFQVWGGGGSPTGKGTLVASSSFPPMSAVTQTITAVGSQGVDIPYWARYIDVIAVGGGKGGTSGGLFGTGDGGTRGYNETKRWERPANGNEWTNLAVTVGAGGTAGGGNGGATSVGLFIGGTLVDSVTAGGATGSLSSRSGESMPNTTFQGMTLVGGAGSNGAGGQPGAGGGGGSQGTGSRPGQPGGAGAVMVRFSQ